LGFTGDGVEVLFALQKSRRESLYRGILLTIGVLSVVKFESQLNLKD
jgi:hypothetical protein